MAPWRRRPEVVGSLVLIGVGLTTGLVFLALLMIEQSACPRSLSPCATGLRHLPGVALGAVLLGVGLLALLFAPLVEMARDFRELRSRPPNR